MDEGQQVLALDVLHGDELHSVGFTQVVNADDVAVRHLMSQQQFLLEAIDDGLVASQIGPDYLQRNGAVQFEVGRLINRAHAALPENLDDLIPLRRAACPAAVWSSPNARRIWVFALLCPPGVGGRTQRNVDHRRSVRRIIQRRLEHRRADSQSDEEGAPSDGVRTPAASSPGTSRRWPGLGSRCHQIASAMVA